MPALGILTCEILELEFAHLLISDPEIQRVTVIEQEYSQTLTTLLEESSLRPRRIKRSEDFVRNGDKRLEVVIRVLELGLHNRMFDFRTETRPGTLDLLEQAWKSAKHSLLL